MALRQPPHAALFDFLLGTGTRPGEALALRWADLDLDTGRATIRRALTTEGKRPAFKEPKTGLDARRHGGLPGRRPATRASSRLS